MNCYLVVLNHEMDDLPVAVFADRYAAEEFAEKVKPMPTQRIRDFYGTDCSTPLRVTVITFRHGRPVNWKMAKLFPADV